MEFKEHQAHAERAVEGIEKHLARYILGLTTWGEFEKECQSREEGYRQAVVNHKRAMTTLKS